jgi:hypothetical protein
MAHSSSVTAMGRGHFGENEHAGYFSPQLRGNCRRLRRLRADPAVRAGTPAAAEADRLAYAASPRMTFLLKEIADEFE